MEGWAQTSWWPWLLRAKKVGTREDGRAQQLDVKVTDTFVVSYGNLQMSCVHVTVQYRHTDRLFRQLQLECDGMLN